MKANAVANSIASASIAIVSAMSLLIAKPAYSLLGLYYGSDTTQITNSGDNPTLGLTVWCPRGKQVLSGGADVNQQDKGFRIIALEPDTENGAWFRAEAAIEEPGFPRGDVDWYLTVHIICADPPPNGLHYGTVSARPNREASQWVRPYCATGEKLVGFGGRVATDAEPRNVALTAVLPSADLRSVIVRGDEMEAGEDSDWFVTAYTVCTEDHVGLTSVLSSSGPPTGIETKTTSSACTNGDLLHAIGGAIFGGFGQVTMHQLYPLADTNGTMHATEDMNGAINVWHVGTAAICG